MKRIYLLFALMGLLALSGCDKMFLKKSTVRVEARRADITVEFPNDERKYLGGYTEEELLELYVEEVKDELDRGRITVIEEGEGNPDYVLTIDHVHMIEFVTNEYEDGEYFDLSEVSIKTEMDILKFQEDQPVEMVSNEEVSEYITTSKDKKGKDDGDPYVVGFGGRDGAFETAAKSVRRTSKKTMKDLQ